MVGLFFCSRDIDTHILQGEYEETIAKSYFRVANFRTLLSKAGCPEAIKYCEPFLKMLSPQNRGTLITDIRSMARVLPSSDDSESEDDAVEVNRHRKPGPEKNLPNNIATIIRGIDRALPVRAVFATRMTLGGLVYSVSSTHAGNSNVLVRKAGDDVLHPAKIEHILQFKSRTVVLVRYHLPTGGRMSYPFDRHPVLKTTVWDAEVGDLSAIEVDQIVCHFAKLCTTWVGQRIAIALSLSRVSLMS